MEFEKFVMIVAGLFLLFGFIVWIQSFIRKKLASPFQYPYFVHRIDVSGRRNPQITELIDEYLVENRMDEIEAHKKIIDKWKSDCEQLINNSRLQNRRRQQFQEAIDDMHAYQFIVYRLQTRYKQVNYVKTAYQVENEISRHGYDYSYLENRNKRLAAIDYQTSLKKYNSKEQRKLMTPALRRQIMERDNYTCQKCGKYMPDEVGLEVDHILPIARGGKTVPSNLQVLCSKCNGHKWAN